MAFNTDKATHIAVVVGEDRHNVQAIISVTNVLHEMLMRGQTYVLSATMVDGDSKKLLCVNLMPESAKEAKSGGD